LYAIPAVNGKLSAHFGHSENFVVIETQDNVITKEYSLDPPEHVPGAYPQFLASHNVNYIIAGGMGQRAIDIFTQNGIEVIMGADSIEPIVLVQAHLGNQLESKENSCDGDHHGGEGDHEHHHHN
jgi:predicted Fe-Mo cluster-binding NifX family protein